MALQKHPSTLTRDQLVALVERLVACHPDLLDLIHLPLPGEARRAEAASVHARVTRALLTMGDDWQASSRTQYELFPIVAVGDDYRKRGHLDDARVVYRRRWACSGATVFPREGAPPWASMAGLRPTARGG